MQRAIWIWYSLCACDGIYLLCTSNGKTSHCAAELELGTGSVARAPTPPPFTPSTVEFSNTDTIP